jgi:hypothetical protein
MTFGPVEQARTDAQAVETLLSGYEMLPSDAGFPRTTLLHEILRRMEIHILTQEEFLYPEARGAFHADEVNRYLRDHKELTASFSVLSPASPNAFSDARVLVVVDNFRAHIERETAFLRVFDSATDSQRVRQIAGGMDRLRGLL